MAVILNFNPCVVPNGIYKHYKGDLYEVLGGMNDAEHNQELVVYRKLSSVNSTDNKLHSRSVGNFTGLIDIDGVGTVARFTHCN